jgi:hypothetical protein
VSKRTHRYAKLCKLWSLLSTISTLLEKATLVVDDTKKSRNLFKKWAMLDVQGLNQSGSPMIAFTWNRPPFGLYEYEVMPFGLTNAPSVFMQAMNDVLDGLSFVSAYLDDILILSKTPKENIELVRKVLQRIKYHGLFLKLAKCEFFKDTSPYLGHIISADGIKPDPRKLSCIKDWPTPKSFLYIISFLRLANYFRRYIHDFTKHAVPLIKLIKGNISRRQSNTTFIHWTKERQTSLIT